jgi:acyl-CoA reductase-like NAD-dependent aldehyde dehydrogenase
MMGETSCTEAAAEHNMRLALSFIVEAAALTTSQVLEGSIPSTTEDNCLALILTEPLGVILSIAPWNAPMILGVRGFLGAVVAGNTAVIKVRCFPRSLTIV